MLIDNVFSICNAYESGYGHGYDKRGLPNPWETGSDEYLAWGYGYDTASRKRDLHEHNKKVKQSNEVD